LGLGRGRTSTWGRKVPLLLFSFQQVSLAAYCAASRRLCSCRLSSIVWRDMVFHGPNFDEEYLGNFLTGEPFGNFID
ncbi:MAG: hypothetical protein P8Y60_06470, partial [Calditrichota bacterium]